VNWAGIVIALVQVVLFVVLAPVLIGVIRQVRARLEGRAGAGIWQPWRDLRKLLAKDPVRAQDSSAVSDRQPSAVVTSGTSRRM